MSRYHPIPWGLRSDRRVLALSPNAKLLHVYGHLFSDSAETDGTLVLQQVRAIAIEAGIADNRVKPLVRELLSSGLWELHDNVIVIVDFAGTTHAELEEKRAKWKSDKDRQRHPNRLPPGPRHRGGSGSDTGGDGGGYPTPHPESFPSSVHPNVHRGQLAVLSSNEAGMVPISRAMSTVESEVESTDSTSRHVTSHQNAAAAREESEAQRGAVGVVLTAWTEQTGRLATDDERELVEAMVTKCDVESMVKDIESAFARHKGVRSLHYFEKRWEERSATTTDEPGELTDDEVARFQDHYERHDGCRGRKCEVFKAEAG